MALPPLELDHLTFADQCSTLIAPIWLNGYLKAVDALEIFVHFSHYFL
jgi:hypothetical protein